VHSNLTVAAIDCRGVGAALPPISARPIVEVRMSTELGGLCRGLAPGFRPELWDGFCFAVEVGVAELAAGAHEFAAVGDAAFDEDVVGLELGHEGEEGFVGGVSNVA